MSGQEPIMVQKSNLQPLMIDYFKYLVSSSCFCGVTTYTVDGPVKFVITKFDCGFSIQPKLNNATNYIGQRNISNILKLLFVKIFTIKARKFGAFSRKSSFPYFSAWNKKRFILSLKDK